MSQTKGRVKEKKEHLKLIFVFYTCDSPSSPPARAPGCRGGGGYEEQASGLPMYANGHTDRQLQI